MNSPNDAPAGTSNDTDVDPIDAEAADIDPRSENAPEQIQQLLSDAEDLGRPVSQEVDPEADSRASGQAEQNDEPNDDDEPEVLPG
jgi:hypothetical protein